MILRITNYEGNPVDPRNAHLAHSINNYTGGYTQIATSNYQMLLPQQGDYTVYVGDFPWTVSGVTINPYDVITVNDAGLPEVIGNSVILVQEPGFVAWEYSATNAAWIQIPVSQIPINDRIINVMEDRTDPQNLTMYKFRPELIHTGGILDILDTSGTMIQCAYAVFRYEDVRLTLDVPPIADLLDNISYLASIDSGVSFSLPLSSLTSTQHGTIDIALRMAYSLLFGVKQTSDTHISDIFGQSINALGIANSADYAYVDILSGAIYPDAQWPLKHSANVFNAVDTANAMLYSDSVDDVNQSLEIYCHNTAHDLVSPIDWQPTSRLLELVNEYGAVNLADLLTNGPLFSFIDIWKALHCIKVDLYNVAPLNPPVPPPPVWEPFDRVQRVTALPVTGRIGVTYIVEPGSREYIWNDQTNTFDQIVLRIPETVQYNKRFADRPPKGP